MASSLPMTSERFVPTILRLLMRPEGPRRRGSRAVMSPKSIPLRLHEFGEILLAVAHCPVVEVVGLEVVVVEHL